MQYLKINKSQNWRFALAKTVCEIQAKNPTLTSYQCVTKARAAMRARRKRRK